MENDIKYIGYTHNIRNKTLPRSTYFLYRAVPMAELCEQLGYRLLMYTPYDVNLENNRVKGYTLINNKFIPTEAEIPLVNGDWFIKGRNTNPKSNKHYSNYKKYRAKSTTKHFYPPRKFSTLVRDKLKTFELLEKFKPGLNPYTEVFNSTIEQLTRFSESYENVFIKPNTGNMGNNIMVLQKRLHGYTLSFYKTKKKVIAFCNTIDEVLIEADTLMAGKKYLIQQGINTPMYKDSTFIIRLIAVYDGEQWHSIYKGVLSAAENSIANSSQGGYNYFLRDLLNKIYGEEKAAHMLEKIIQTAAELSTFLDSKYEVELMEIAYDFVIDTADDIHVVEINTKPGATKPGIKFTNPKQEILNRTAEQEEMFQKYAMPHATHLVNFLIKKMNDLT